MFGMTQDRRAWLTTHAGTSTLHERERNRAEGLPSVFTPEAYQRIEARMAKGAPPQRRTAGRAPQRFASIAAVEAAGFKRVAGGMYKDAHSVWELRPGDGDEVYLVRQHEERLVDLRPVAGIGTQAAVESGIVRGARRTAGTLPPWLAEDDEDEDDAESDVDDIDTSKYSAAQVRQAVAMIRKAERDGDYLKAAQMKDKLKKVLGPAALGAALGLGSAGVAKNMQPQPRFEPIQMEQQQQQAPSSRAPSPYVQPAAPSEIDVEPSTSNTQPGPGTADPSTGELGGAEGYQVGDLTDAWGEPADVVTARNLDTWASHMADYLLSKHEFVTDGLDPRMLRDDPEQRFHVETDLMTKMRQLMPDLQFDGVERTDAISALVDALMAQGDFMPQGAPSTDGPDLSGYEAPGTGGDLPSDLHDAPRFVERGGGLQSRMAGIAGRRASKRAALRTAMSRDAQVEPEDLWDAHEVMHGREPEYGGGPITQGVEEIEGGDAPELPGMGAPAPKTAPPTHAHDKDDEDYIMHSNKQSKRRGLKPRVGMRITAISNGRVAEGVVLELLPLGDLLADFGAGGEEVAGDLVLEPELDLDLDGGDDAILDIELDELDDMPATDDEDTDEGEAEEEEETCEDCGHAGCPLDCPDDCECLSDTDADDTDADDDDDDLFGDIDLDDIPEEEDTSGGGGGEQMVLVITVDDAMDLDMGGDIDPFIP